MVLDWARTGDNHGVVLRPPLLMGGGVRGNLGRMFTAVAKRRFPPLPEFNNHRSLLHVDDLVDALIRVIDLPDAREQTFFVAYPRPYSTREIVNTMRIGLGRRPQGWSVPALCWRSLARLGDVWGSLLRRRAPFDREHLARLSESACYDATLFEDITGFRPGRSLADAVREMCEIEHP